MTRYKYLLYLVFFYFRAMISGGGAPEIEIAQKLAAYANTTFGLDQYCLRAFADAFEVIPYTLAENAGLNPIDVVTELRALHAKNMINAGINIRSVSYLIKNFSIGS